VSGGDGIMWVMLILAAIAIWGLYRPILGPMLFTPGYATAKISEPLVNPQPGTAGATPSPV